MIIFVSIIIPDSRHHVIRHQFISTLFEFARLIMPFVLFTRDAWPAIGWLYLSFPRS